MPATGQLGQISVCTFLCAFACKCGPLSLHVYIQGPQASGVTGGGIRCRPSPERALIRSAAGSVCCRSACFYGAHEHMRGGTHTLLERPHKQHLKNILHTHTLRSYGLKETHWGCRLNLLKRKNRCIRKKWKGKGCRLVFGNDNNSVSQTRAQRFY